MQITIEYPQVMKMQMYAKIEVPPTSSLDEVKAQVMQSFWDTFLVHFPRYPDHRDKGTIDMVVIKDKGLELRTDEEFRARLSPTANFQAVFINHPPVRGKKLDELNGA